MNVFLPQRLAQVLVVVEREALPPVSAGSAQSHRQAQLGFQLGGELLAELDRFF